MEGRPTIVRVSQYAHFEPCSFDGYESRPDYVQAVRLSDYKGYHNLKEAKL